MPDSVGPVLVLAPRGRDAALTTSFLEKVGIETRVCASMDELAQGIENVAAAALLTEDALTAPGLLLLSRVLDAQPAWSDLPIAVFRGRDEGKRGLSAPLAALLRRGNVSLLDRPVRKVTLVTTAQAFLRARRRQVEVRELMQQLQKSVKDRDSFLAILGHELRNPLGTIVMSTELMAISGKTAFRREREVIERQTGVLCRLVDDLLEVARVTSGKIRLQTVPVNLVKLLERVLPAARSSAITAGLTLTTTIEAGSPYVEGDPVRLEQILNNLLKNAVKYTPRGGSISVRLSEEGENAVVRVKDSGIGIAPEMALRVFDLFAQASGALDRSQGGMGIGLMLVRELVTLHQGTVSVESEGIGRGSEFTVSLPVSDGEREQEHSGAILHSAAGPTHIVVVEDQSDLRQALELLLRDSGHRVESAGDGLTGVERILTERPTVAFVDIGLPGIDGYEVARRIRAVLGQTISLVALTGYGQPEDRQRALEAGFDAHLCKPVRVATLEQMVARFS